MSLQRLWTRGAIYLVLLAFAAFYLMPFYVMIITSLKPYTDVNVTRMWELPRGIYFEGIAEAWRAVSPNFRNSMVITIPAALISALIGSINGYIFAKWRFRGADTLFILFLVGMFLPYQGVLYFWHSDHGAALPRLLWRHPQRVARCGQNRRLRLFWHLPLDLAADLHARVCRGAALAIYLDLE
jgi:hypothetical protein